MRFAGFCLRTRLDVFGPALAGCAGVMVAVVVSCAAVSSAAVAAETADAKGVWIDHTGRGAVEIIDCNGRLCGSVVWLRDEKNSKACGVQILGNVPPIKPGIWDGGWIYDPEENAKYSVEISFASESKLKIYGYAGMKLFGETMYWTRAPAGLPRCKA